MLSGCLNTKPLKGKGSQMWYLEMLVFRFFFFYFQTFLWDFFLYFSLILKLKKSWSIINFQSLYGNEIWPMVTVWKDRQRHGAGLDKKPPWKRVFCNKGDTSWWWWGQSQKRFNLRKITQKCLLTGRDAFTVFLSLRPVSPFPIRLVVIQTSGWSNGKRWVVRREFWKWWEETAPGTGRRHCWVKGLHMWKTGKTARGRSLRERGS